mgnify:CR=1 FL=1
MSENKKLVSDRIVDYLERRGVEYVFGLCGHTVIGLLDGMSRATKLLPATSRSLPMQPTATPA